MSALLVSAAGAIAAPVSAADTAAGTRITNTATMRFTSDGIATRIDSNTVTLTIDERLDVAIVANRPSIAITGEQGVVAVPFTVSNRGNADEGFAVSAVADRPQATIAGIAADENDDGVYDPAVDRALAGPLALKAGERRRIFVLVANVSAGGNVAVAATARAITGAGAPGTVFAGAGAGGGDAIVGPTGASATASSVLAPGGGLPVLEKSQGVVAPDGSARAMRGSVVTYRLDARFVRAAGAAEVSDPVPPGTAFVPGSILLDGQAMTDAADDDAASFDGGIVRVALGDVAGASVRTIQFKTQIQ